MRAYTLSWYTMPGGFRQCTTGRSTLSQRDYRHLVRLAGQSVAYSQAHSIDGYAETTTVPRTAAITAYINARRMTRPQRVQYFQSMEAERQYKDAVVEKVESTRSIAKRVFC